MAAAPPNPSRIALLRAALAEVAKLEPSDAEIAAAAAEAAGQPSPPASWEQSIIDFGSALCGYLGNPEVLRIAHAAMNDLNPHNAAKK